MRGVVLAGVTAAAVFLAAGCSDAPGAAQPTGEASAIIPHGWQAVAVAARNGPELTVVFEDGSRSVVDLRAVSAFDCRTDCWADVKDALPALGATDRVCVWGLGRVTKLWVNRPVCAGG